MPTESQNSFVQLAKNIAFWAMSAGITAIVVQLWGLNQEFAGFRGTAEETMKTLKEQLVETKNRQFDLIQRQSKSDARLDGIDREISRIYDDRSQNQSQRPLR